MFQDWITTSEGMKGAAETAVKEVLKVKPNEKALVITNPSQDVHEISLALYDALVDAKANPVLLVQPRKTQLDFTEDAVLKAFECKPDIVMSISDEKIGKDPLGIKKPYLYKGKEFDHIFHYLLDGTKTTRAFWSPTITREIFVNTVPIDYKVLQARAAAIKKIFDEASEIAITTEKGMDLTMGIRGRLGMSDDGNFSAGGLGGNLPAGETFVSPELSTARGIIVFDGSISSHNGEILIEEPIRVEVKDGYAVKIEGGTEAEELRNTLRISEENARRFEKEGKLKSGDGDIFSRNAYNIGELGIGLNPKAQIIGNMLVDEKAFKTCHIAIGSNYDDDAPSLTHLDGLIGKPTITARYKDGREVTFIRDGELLL